ncbi:BREX-1 system adenine-specific DNA-methyltransferase PglX (plasmid) [Nocardia sp. NBC_01377]|uniref:Eco57I restriction-modification methylase domain-containing protein n=1 Tax=Nocardia sp. NBC_01377 TaxID=2903595 RepID=UPI00324BC3DD
MLQTSGPFLTLPVVNRVFPNGLYEVAPRLRSKVRSTVAEALATRGATRHTAIRTVLDHALDWADHLRVDTDLPASLSEPVPEHGLLLRPDFGFYAEPGGDDLIEADDEPADEEDSDAEDDAAATNASDSPWRLLGMITDWGTHPFARTTAHGWSASPVERLAVLLRARDVPIGLVTDGRWWAVVWAPVGGTMGAAVWDASLWAEEPESLRAFVALLDRPRFLGVAAEDRLPELLKESLGAQEEVTETLGRQVRDAVELLVRTLDQLDSESGVLDGVGDDDLYDGVVTLMMRIVFLLFAEERRLLPSDDDVYVAAYSVSRLVEQLEAAEALVGAQALEHRTGAWHRLLAVSRALHYGVAHEDLRLPAYGGGLFDPDRYPWLEGHSADDLPGARPPAVDDRTVLRLLRAVQYVEVGGERRRLTFRALDVEQIGYVYEGLLELEVRTASEVMLSLVRPSIWPKGKKPAEVTLSDAIEQLKIPVGKTMSNWVEARTGLSEKNVAAAFEQPLPIERRSGLLRALNGEEELASMVEPYAGVLRWDELDRPSVTLPGRRLIAPSARRASTGAHYTPRALAEEVASNALEPLAYRPGPLETADRSTWRIRPSTELLELRVADIAMGSGAFLVAACRYLADRLVEAWVAEGRPEALLVARHSGQARLAADAEVEQIALEARRLVTEHCLYGVDINPLAVEMAKLSLWLVTMDRERPFGFLDDRLVAGDSLLGLASLTQLTTLHAHPDGGPAELGYADSWEDQLAQAADLRRRITAQPVTTGRDVAFKSTLLAEARTLTTQLGTVADAVTGVGLLAMKLPAKKSDAKFAALSISVGNAAPDYKTGLKEHIEAIQAGRPDGVVPRTPLHWPLAFPEVFADTEARGFDAIIGNPPFLGGKKISGALGDDYLGWLQRWDGRGIKGSADLAARFVLRAERLLSSRGQLGYIATNTLVQGETLVIGLAQTVGRGLVIRRGRPSHRWPSASANLEIIDIWATRAPVAPDGVRWLAGEEVPEIGPDLEPVGRVRGRPQPLPENDNLAFIGSYVLGLGFTMTEDQALSLIDHDPNNADVLQPYVIGKDLNQRPDCSASRWIINFRDWSLERAKDLPDALEIVERLVKPERDKKKRDVHRLNWWQYADRRVGLYREAAKLDHVLAISLHGSVVMPVRIPTGPVFSHACGVFALDDYASLAVLSSSIHTTWVVRYTSTLETRIRYAPSDVFLTLPRPPATPELEMLGKRLNEERRSLMLARGWGLTTTYNHVHEPTDRDPEVVALRDLHTDIDQAVMTAYGWDLNLEVGHHQTKIGIRWTVSPQARFELLDLLLEENHRRAGYSPPDVIQA